MKNAVLWGGFCVLLKNKNKQTNSNKNSKKPRWVLWTTLFQKNIKLLLAYAFVSLLAMDRSLLQIIHYNRPLLFVYLPLRKNMFLPYVTCLCDCTLYSSDCFFPLLLLEFILIYYGTEVEGYGAVSLNQDCTSWIVMLKTIPYSMDSWATQNNFLFSLIFIYYSLIYLPCLLLLPISSITYPLHQIHPSSFPFSKGHVSQRYQPNMAY